MSENKIEGECLVSLFEPERSSLRALLLCLLSVVSPTETSKHQLTSDTTYSQICYLISERQSSFKKTVDQEDGRRRREEVQLSIRKAKKDDRLSKRRMAPSATTTASTTDLPVKEYSLGEIPQLVRVLVDVKGETAPLLEAARAIRRMLSAAEGPPFEEVINAGALPFLVELLMRVDCYDLQFEAAWALTNIASTNFTSVVAETPNAIKYLIDLLRSPKDDVREQCAWCLGNIAGDGAEYRDRVLRQGAIGAL